MVLLWANTRHDPVATPKTARAAPFKKVRRLGRTHVGNGTLDTSYCVPPSDTTGFCKGSSGTLNCLNTAWIASQF